MGNDITSVTNPSLDLTFYTDTDLIIKKFQITLTPELVAESLPVQIDACISSGSTPTSLTSIVALNFVNVPTDTIARTTFVSDVENEIKIPANSYYSILIRQANGELFNNIINLSASWTLILDPSV